MRLLKVTLKDEPVMNDRIKELEKQCWSHRVDGALIDGHLHFDTKKFAELIIFECIKLAVFKGDSATGQAIKEHFGVEE